MGIRASSRGTPRVANRLLRRVRDYAEVRGEGRITAAVAEEALRLEGIDSAGLDELDRRLLRTLIDVFGGGPAGVEALAASLNEEVDTLSEVVEPYLLKAGFIVRTPAGRRATARARRHLGDGGERP
ncbi:MAG: Holliday junction branch migration DNA helicase RuvB, partial [Clostridia bacterium]|nr:Holliday junction branch migration DNA helicase RuvB [Clostridia bacterium]